jgi:hypothetical protein
MTKGSVGGPNNRKLLLGLWPVLPVVRSGELLCVRLQWSDGRFITLKERTSFLRIEVFLFFQSERFVTHES